MYCRYFSSEEAGDTQKQTNKPKSPSGPICLGRSSIFHPYCQTHFLYSFPLVYIYNIICPYSLFTKKASLRACLWHPFSLRKRMVPRYAVWSRHGSHNRPEDGWFCSSGIDFMSVSKFLLLRKTRKSKCILIVGGGGMFSVRLVLFYVLLKQALCISLCLHC